MANISITLWSFPFKNLRYTNCQNTQIKTNILDWFFGKLDLMWSIDTVRTAGLK